MPYTIQPPSGATAKRVGYLFKASIPHINVVSTLCTGQKNKKNVRRRSDIRLAKEITDDFEINIS